MPDSSRPHHRPACLNIEDITLEYPVQGIYRIDHMGYAQPYLAVLQNRRLTQW